MKINRLIKAFSLLLIVAFAACSDFEDTVATSPEKSSGNQGVYFPKSNPELFELEPAAETEVTLTIAREVSTGAVQVPLIVEVNTDNVFKVPQSVSFASGEKEVEFTVTFPEAKEGEPYVLKLAVAGDDIVDPYASASSNMTTTVSRIKWSPVGRPMVYIDGAFLAIFGVSQYPMYVEGDSVKLESTVRYRFRNAFKVPTLPAEPDDDGIFDGYPYNEAGDFDTSKDWLITVEIDEDDEVFMSASEIGVDWSYGMISVGSVYGNTAVTEKDAYPWGVYDEDAGSITFGANSLYLSMANFNGGGKYPSAFTTTIYLSKEDYLAANLKIEDFNDLDYDKIEGDYSLYESLAYDDLWTKTIYKAVDVDEDNEQSEYKDLFYIADVYNDDYGLAFYNYDGVIRIPESQPTGIEFLGNEVFVSQSPSRSSSVFVNFKGVTVYTFGLIFHYEDGTVVGDFFESFYYSKDAFTYTKDDFLGVFSLLGGVDPMEVEIAEKSANNFEITGIEYADKVAATFDPTGLTLTISPQELGNATIEGEEGEEDVTYETAWFTLLKSGQSNTVALQFAFNLRGELAVTDATDGIGFRIRGYNVEDEDDMPWLLTIKDPLFTVPVDEEVDEQAVSYNHLRLESKVGLQGPNFSIQGKMKSSQPQVLTGGSTKIPRLL